MAKKHVLISTLFVVFLFACGLILETQPVEAKKPVLIRCVLPQPEGDFPITHMVQEMAKRFNDRAKGEYVIEVYAGGALAKLPEYFDAVRIGVVEMAFSNWGTFSFLDPRMGLLETPFLFTNNMSTHAACKPMLPLYDKVLQEKFNAKGICITTSGGLGLFSQKPVTKLEDWKGLLVGAVSPFTATLIKDLGGAPVTIVFTDLYESLQKKIVDGATQSSHGGLVFGLHDICKHFTAFFGIPAVAGYTINLDVWKKMPPEIQQVLVEETQAGADWLANVLVNELPKADLEIFEKKGTTVYYLSPEERAIWAKKLEPFMEAEMSKNGELGQKIRQIAKDVNERFPYSDQGIL
ncbi:MAG: TRAP transporter substrate-binding protein DctP [Deltaproteobacteria bacterium]|nr:TRAP transporter substrate-binding protein DctP [Deltaproteobacteria bacterium]